MAALDIAWHALVVLGALGFVERMVRHRRAYVAKRRGLRAAPPAWCSPRFQADEHLPEPATAAARRSAARRGNVYGLTQTASTPYRPDSPLEIGRPGSPAASRDLLTGLNDALLMEGASAAVRGDEHNAGVLVYLADHVADARDAITDAG